MTHKNSQTHAGSATYWFAWSPKRWYDSLPRFFKCLSQPPKVHAPLFWTASTIVVFMAVGLGFLALLPFDEILAARLDDLEHPLVELWRELTDLGMNYPYLVASALVGLIVAGLDWGAASYRNRLRLRLVYTQALFVFGSFSLSSITTYLGKFLFGRARPKFLEELGAEYFDPFSVGHDFASFPSGHATAFGTLAAILAIWFPRWRSMILPLLFLLAFSRVAAGAHYPTDVVAGFSIGMLATIWLARFLARREIGFHFVPRSVIPFVMTGRWNKTLV